MPGFDGTGPLAQGPGTGRGLGPCGARVRNPWGYWGVGFGRRWFGLGRGFGQGRGWFGRGRGFGKGFGRGFGFRKGFWW